MPREHTPFEDDLQVKPADLDLRIVGSFRNAAQASHRPVDAQSDGDDVDDDGIDSPVEFAPPPPRRPTTLVRVVGSRPVPNGGAWTIPLVCLGIGIIAMALIIPAATENRRLVWEREKLARELAHVEKQIAINNEFLARLATDPGLAERLAQRQMNMVREGTSVLQLPGREAGPEISPFELVTLPPPAPMPEFRPIGGQISRWFDHPKLRLYLLGAGLLSLIVGVILGSQKNQPRPA